MANAKALLKSAIRSDNPIIFFEHVLLYNVKGMLLGAADPLLVIRSAPRGMVSQRQLLFPRSLASPIDLQPHRPVTGIGVSKSPRSRDVPRRQLLLSRPPDPPRVQHVSHAFDGRQTQLAPRPPTAAT